MDLVIDILISLLTVMSIMFVVNFIRYFFKIGKIFKETKDNPNVKGIAVVNGEIKVIENNMEDIITKKPRKLVKDPVCQQEVDKENSYRAVADGIEYYFCSWECRQEFIEKRKNINN